MTNEIRVRNTIKKIKYEESTISMNLTSSLEEQLPQILTDLHLDSSKVKISNLKFFIIKSNEKIEITETNKSLHESNFSKNDSLQIEEKNMELSAELCITIAYAGPILVFLIFYYLNPNLSTKQFLIFFLANLHYAKRIYETNFVHIYGKGGFPFLSFEYFGLVVYYWGLFGVLVGYYSLSSEYSKTNNELNWTHYLAIFCHLFCELNNYKSHIILRDLKLNNSGNRGIPSGNMFDYVANSHYFWELFSWFFFSLFVRNNPSYLFVVFSFASMSFIAVEKHKNMKKYFGDKYPKNLKAFIPFIL